MEDGHTHQTLDSVIGCKETHIKRTVRFINFTNLCGVQIGGSSFTEAVVLYVFLYEEREDDVFGVASVNPMTAFITVLRYLLKYIFIYSLFTLWKEMEGAIHFTGS